MTSEQGRRTAALAESMVVSLKRDDLIHVQGLRLQVGRAWNIHGSTLKFHRTNSNFWIVE